MNPSLSEGEGGGEGPCLTRFDPFPLTLPSPQWGEGFCGAIVNTEDNLLCLQFGQLLKAE